MASAGRDAGFGIEELWRSTQSQLQVFQKRGGSLRIFTAGKAGAGKSSLVCDLIGPGAKEKPAIAAGWDPCTIKVREYEIPVATGVSVYVYDTRGMFDAVAGDHEDKTTDSIGEVCRNDASGVLIVCIPMHDRLDESAVETIASLHQKFGKEIWRYAVIALTKADQYPRDQWLSQGSKKWYKKTEPILKTEFENYLQKCKNSLRTIFTSSEAGARRRCYIGMTKEEYDKLEIPILPTSTLTRDFVSKMRAVGHEYWFDLLLVECCKREQGMALVNIHSKRLNNLPDEILKLIDPNGVLEPRFLEFIQKLLKALGKKTPLIIAWNLYHNYKYSHSVATAPRFETNNIPACDT